MADVKLSNVIGAPFSGFVLEQLNQRAIQNSTVARTNEQVLFLANKMSWARLVSSINIALPPLTFTNNLFQIGASVASSAFYESLGLDYTQYPAPDSLAKKWILEAGTSVQNGNGIDLRQGIGLDGAYGLGDTEELGYRPMPGLTSVQVQTMGTLGSLKQATVNFKVWNMNQLNVIEALYFRLGYSMLLEWGHVQYFQNDGEFKQDGIYGIDDPFRAGRRKEDIQQEIARKVRSTAGNYDGMLGIVSNFNWAFNQSGGYDCTIRLIGLGAIMESLKIDQTYTLPEGFISRFQKDQTAIGEIAASRVSREGPAQPPQPLVPEPTPKTRQELYAIVKKYDGYRGDYNQFLAEYGAERYNYQSDLVTKFDSVYANIVPKQQSDQRPEGIEYATQKEAASKFNGLWVFYSNRAILIKNPPANQVTPASISFNALTKFFEAQSRRFSLSGRSSLSKYFETGALAQAPAGLSAFNLSPQAAIDVPFQKLQTPLPVASLETAAGLRQGIYFVFTKIQVEIGDPDYRVTIGQIAEALDKLVQINVVKAEITSIDFNSPYAKIFGQFKINIDAEGIGPAAGKVKPAAVTFVFETSNPGIIAGSEVETVIPPPVTAATAGNSGDTSGAENQSSTLQVETPKGFESALHAMLTIVKARVQASTDILNFNVGVVDITEPTQKFYDSGIFKEIFKLEPTAEGKPPKIVPRKSPVAGPNGLPFEVNAYALKGFNTELMKDPTLYNQVDDVNFTDLCKALIIRYPNPDVDESLRSLAVPVYISFGYLLAFLNNMCLVYDSTKSQISKEPTGNQKHPYIYIDFNPETNFCLTSPQQFSIDPSICMIPAQSTLKQYQSIFPESVVLRDTKGEITSLKGGGGDDAIFFNPEKNNSVSTVISSFAQFQNIKNNSPYQGKLMNILLNVDYLLGLANSFRGNDPEHAVRLQPFLETLIAGVNKALGNMNLLKVRYNDDANTIQIQDSQWAPSLEKEVTVMTRETGIVSRGMLPVFGQQSIAREFQFKTVMSTKLASTIAISAQAATGSVNATDHSSFSWLNQNFQDRYKPYIQNPDNKATGTNTTGKPNTNEVSNEVKAAQMFNKHVKQIYEDPANYTNTKVDLAKNYYIEVISKVKSTNPTTVSAPFIPADLELTIDGIGGIIMGNAFLIPEDRMPRSLRGQNGIPKVGFIVTALNHTIEKNQWLTKMRGQMIKLRDYKGFGIVTATEGIVGTTAARTGRGSSRRLSGVGTGCIRTYSTAIANAGPGFDSLKKTLTNSGLNSTIALASILAIVGGESRWDSSTEENFRYSAARLSEVFPNLTADQNARALAAKTRKEFFSIVYGEYKPSRVGNRNVQDGGLYYGRGYIGLTGYENYKRYGGLIGKDLVNNPSLASDPTVAAQIVVAYIKDRVKLDINSPDYFETAVYAVGNPVDPEVKVGYYNCLLGQV